MADRTTLKYLAMPLHAATVFIHIQLPVITTALKFDQSHDTEVLVTGSSQAERMLSATKAHTCTMYMHSQALSAGLFSQRPPSSTQGRRNRTGRGGHGHPTFSAFFFFGTLQQSAMISAQTWQILVPDRGLLQNQKSMYTEMAPNAWECLQLASIFEFFPGGG